MPCKQRARGSNPFSALYQGIAGDTVALSGAVSGPETPGAATGGELRQSEHCEFIGSNVE
jgi:hypothetical protein